MSRLNRYKIERRDSYIGYDNRNVVVWRHLSFVKAMNEQEALIKGASRWRYNPADVMSYRAVAA